MKTEKIKYRILCFTFFITAFFFHTDVLFAGSPLTREEQTTLYQAQESIKKKDYQKARKIITEYLQKYPDKPNPLTFYALGNAWYLSGNLNKAAEAYERGYQTHPASYMLCINLATVFYELGKYDKAGKYFEKAYELSKPPEKELLYQAGTAYYQAKSFKKSASVLKRLVSGKAGSITSELRNNSEKLLIHVALELGDWKSVESALMLFLKQHPTDTEHWKLLSHSRLKQNDYRGAAGALEILYEITVPNRNELEELSNLYFYMSFPLKAIRCLEKAYGLHPNPKECDKLSRAYLQAHRPDKAIYYLNMAIRQEKTSERLLDKGKILYEQGDWNEAMKSLRQCVHICPHNDVAHLLCGYCAIEKEDFKFARESFLKVSKNAYCYKEALFALRTIKEMPISK